MQEATITNKLHYFNSRHKISNYMLQIMPNSCVYTKLQNQTYDEFHSNLDILLKNISTDNIINVCLFIFEVISLVVLDIMSYSQ